MCPEVVPFKAGSTFSFMFKIPDNIPDGYFSDWALSAQLRKKGNSMPSGLIAYISCYWLNKEESRYVGFFHNLTEDWPKGIAELDVLLTSPSGQKVRSNTVLFNIQRGVTQ